MTGDGAALVADGSREKFDARARGRRDVVLLWLLSHMFFEVVALVAVAVAGPARNREPGFFGLLHHWDSGWFDVIMRDGYFGPNPVDAAHPGARAAFFPGYPLTARAIGWLTGGGELTTTSGRFALWLVPLLASFVAAMFLYRTVEPRFGTAVARWSTAILLFGPYAVFLSASYSESLYLAFAIGAWWALTRNHPVLAGVLAAGASWSRINGAFLAVALVVLYLQQQRAAGARVQVRALAGLLLSFAGVAAYLGWLWARTGQATFWLKAQSEGFAHQAVWPWISLLHALKLPITDGRFAYRVQHSAELVTAALLVVAIVVFVRAREWAATVYVTLSIVSLVTNISYQSLARNGITLFPVLVLAAVVVVRSRHRTAVHVGLGIAGVLTVVNAALFSLGFWAD